jgi:prepilin-type processing-associated H-X9-DG protein
MSMKAKVQIPRWSPSQYGTRAFTLLELLVVIATIIVLGALLLPVLSRVRTLGQSASCKNHLRQIGIALAMYVGLDNHRYPPMWGEDTGPFEIWADRLVPYSPVNWTNRSWHCPTYIADGGIIKVVKPPPAERVTVMTSYSYNAYGVSRVPGISSDLFKLGLGSHPGLNIAEPEVLVPSEMFAVADARPARAEEGRWGDIAMKPYQFTSDELGPPHIEGYNTLFCDSHVALVKRSDYLFPPRTAHNWNRDNQSHRETWAPRNQWAVQN